MYSVVCLFLLALVSPDQPTQPTREQKVRDDRTKVEAEGYWIYNDFTKAVDQARQNGKPLFVILRCVPCVECVKLDDELMSKDPELRRLLDRFVCVRLVSTNGLDLSLFQFDNDQSFAAFLMNADGTVYGRFGTRSHRTNWVGDVSLEGLAKALEGALTLHAEYPKNKALLAAKRGPAPEFLTPEQYPALRGKYGPALNFSGNVVASCVHCHQIGDAQRQYYRTRREPIPETVLFPYPHPKTLGLLLDPKEKATVASVVPGSLADRTGLRQGDIITTVAGQPLLSIADVQWVLHAIPPEGGNVQVEVTRDGTQRSVALTLPAGWRRAGDLSWRSSTWGLRRMALGGLQLEELPTDVRKQLAIPDAQMALRVKHVGQYGPHAAAKQAGFRAGDVLVEFAGCSDLFREADVLTVGVTSQKPGDQVPVTVLRDGKRVQLTMPMQE